MIHKLEQLHELHYSMNRQLDTIYIYTINSPLAK